MALRPIDNALPLSPERSRPKKQSKISTDQGKKPELSSTMENDENQALGAAAPVNPESVFEYILSEDLKPIPDPEAEIQGLVDGLESKDWTKMCSSLNDVRRLALYHSDLLLPLLDKVTSALLKAMKNPRSTLCKTSIMACSDVFKAYGDKLVLEETNNSGGFDQLLLQLLLKASQDKRFVCEEADKALYTLVQSSPPFPLLRKLQTYINHNNPRIRAKAAMSISKCVSTMNTEEVTEFGFATLLKIGAEMLNDQLPEAREAARSTVVALYNKFPKNDDNETETQTETEQQSWEQLCQSCLTTPRVQAIMKIIESL